MEWGRPGLRPQRLNVPHVRKAHEPGERVDPDRLRWLLPDPRLLDLLDLGLMLIGRAGNELVAAEARLHRGDARLARDRHGGVAVHAGDATLTRVNVVAKKDGLAGTLEPARVADDARPAGFLRLAGLRGERAGHEDDHGRPGRGPATPLRSEERRV